MVVDCSRDGFKFMGFRIYLYASMLRTFSSVTKRESCLFNGLFNKIDFFLLVD